MLDSLDISSNVSAELNRSMTAMQAFETKLRGYKQRKESLFSELNSLDKNIEDLVEDYKTVTLYINSIPNQDKIVAAVNSRNEYVQIQKDCLVKQGAEELTLEEPEIVKQGNKYGVSLKASAPSIHIMCNKPKSLEAA